MTATTPLQQDLNDLHSSFPTPYFDETAAMALAPGPSEGAPSPCAGPLGSDLDGCSSLTPQPASAENPSTESAQSPETAETVAAPLDSNPMLAIEDVSGAASRIGLGRSQYGDLVTAFTLSLLLNFLVVFRL